MKTRIVKIGNSQGIRIPKGLLEKSNLQGEVELVAQDDQLIIRSIQQPREGWKEAFLSMAAQGDDRLLDDLEASPTGWDETEWQW